MKQNVLRAIMSGKNFNKEKLTLQCQILKKPKEEKYPEKKNIENCTDS